MKTATRKISDKIGSDRFDGIAGKIWDLLSEELGGANVNITVTSPVSKFGNQVEWTCFAFLLDEDESEGC